MPSVIVDKFAKSIRKTFGCFLRDDLMFHGHLRENRERVAVGVLQLGRLRRADEEIHAKRLLGILHARDLAEPAVRLFLDALRESQVQRHGFDTVPLLVFVGTGEFNLVIRDADLLRLQPAGDVFLVKRPLKSRPNLVVGTASQRSLVVELRDVAGKEILKFSRRVIAKTTADRSPLQGGANGVRPKNVNAADKRTREATRGCPW